jgi:hypothetical protein
MKMKKIITLTLLLLTVVQFSSYAQETTREKYGKTLNLGVGLGGHYGYYKYAGNSIPVLHIDYELDVAKNFTLAPFLNIHTYSRRHYWGNNNYPYRNYYYRETGLGMGAKGTYYFDEILKADSKWDFYLAGSLGFVAVFSRWDADYYGDKDYYHRSSPLFLDFHIGAEYHINNRLGLFLDLSSGLSTFGIAIH